MRDIKFRAWDKEEKKWYKDDFYVQDSKAFILDDDGGCDDPDCCGGRGYYMSHSEDLIPVEYTGLKDKNGKEIYEGDIVKSNIEHSWKGSGTLTGQVEMTPEFWHEFIEYGLDNAELEIIGNIYENKELLK